jgi:hypothetical protein
MSVNIELFEPGGLFPWLASKLLIFVLRAAHSHDLSLSLKLIRLRLVTVARLTLRVQLDFYASAVDQIGGPSPEERPIDPRQPVIAYRRRGN